MRGGTAAAFALALAPASAAPPRPPPTAADSMRVNSPAVPFALEPLRWGSVSPAGWIRDWAVAGRNGLVSPDHAAFAHVRSPSGATVDGWRDGRPPASGYYDEDSAYWIDGMTRMGLVLNDTALIARVAEDFAHTIANPIDFHNTWRNAHDLGSGSAEGWVRSVYSRGMLAYYDATGDKAVLDFLVDRFSNYTAQDSVSDRSLTQVEALLEGHAYGGPRSMVDTALDMLKVNPVSTSWITQFKKDECFSREALDSTAGICMKNEHGVTFNELSKLHAMAYSWNGDAEYLNTSLNAFNMLEQFDLQVHGVNTACEGLSGITPNVGTETCDVVDFQYSNAWLLRITGDARVHGDRLEKAFHNAAPGAINRTYTGHVYNQSPNLVKSSVGYNNKDHNDDHRWRVQWFHTPPCCTGNQARLLPNYIHHMWYATPDGGIAATMYGPNRVRAVVGDDGTPVEVTVSTAYPFGDVVRIRVATGGRAARFPLLLRVPGWCRRPGLTVAGRAAAAAPDARGFVRVARAWADGDEAVLALPAEIRATKRVTFGDGTQGRSFNPLHPNQGMNATSGLPFCVVERGSITFALPMEADPDAPFGFAIDCNASTMRLTTSPMPKGAWDWPLDAPLKVTARARPFAWRDAWLMPSKPITDEETIGPEQDITLVPYGSAKVLHISMFPYLQK